MRESSPSPFSSSPGDRSGIPSLDRLGDELEAAAARALSPSRAVGVAGAAAITSRRPARSSSWRPWLLAPALAALVALVFVTSAVFSSGDRQGDSAEAAVAGAMKRSSEVSTGRFRLRLSVMPSASSGSTGAGSGATETTVDADGAYDTAKARVRATVDASALSSRLAPAAGGALPADVKADVIVDRGALYVSIPALAGPAGPRWFRLVGTPAVSSAGPASEPAAGLAEAPADPSGLLDLFGGVEGVAVAGAETIDGVATTHYQGEVDLDRAARDLDPVERRRMEQSLGLIGGGLPRAGRAPVDVWVDANGFVRRLASTMTITPTAVGVPGSSSASAAGAATGSSSLAGVARFSIDFSDLGAPVDIQPPAPADVAELPVPTTTR